MGSLVICVLVGIGWMDGVYGTCETEMRKVYKILVGKPECEMEFVFLLAD
jgi:hypothetical protein